MWAYLLLAGIFSVWWGALAFAAPPAQNLMASTTSKNYPLTRRDDRFRADRSLSFALATTRRYVDRGTRGTNDGYGNEETTRNDLEPYGSHRPRTSSRRRSQRRDTLERPRDSGNSLGPVGSLDKIRVEEPEPRDLSRFRRDSLQRLWDEGSNVPRNSPVPPELRPDDATNRPNRGRRLNFHDLMGIDPDTDSQLDNFMNYQVTPMSLRDVSFKEDYSFAPVEDSDYEVSEELDHRRSMDLPEANGEDGRTIRGDSIESRNRVVAGDRITLARLRGFREQDETRRSDPVGLRSDRTSPEEGPTVRNVGDATNHPKSTALYPSIDEPDFAPNAHHSTQTPLDSREAMSYPESSMERPRVTRSAGQRARNRTKAESPREQRRQGRNKERRGQNWCPDVDVGNRAYLAPTVFEGKARSMSSARKPGSNYAVTFEVKQVYKSQPGFQPLLKNDSVRLHFRDKAAGKSTLCSSESNGHDNQSGVVRANIKRGKVYLVFVNRVGPRNFTILGEPVIRSKKNEQAVQAVIRPDYVREVTLSELRDAVARLRDRVKLVCRTRGSPPPRVHWLKDGVPLHPRRGLRIQHKRRRSKVVIASARAEDSGRYECVAESTSGHRAALAAQLRIAHASETTTAAWPRQEQPCPISGDFCMNGGTCLFFETVGEPACRCAEGFTGQRCETKDVISTGSVYNRHRAPFSCKLGLSTSYYC